MVHTIYIVDGEGGLSYCLIPINCTCTLYVSTIKKKRFKSDEFLVMLCCTVLMICHFCYTVKIKNTNYFKFQSGDLFKNVFRFNHPLYIHIFIVQKIDLIHNRMRTVIYPCLTGANKNDSNF